MAGRLLTCYPPLAGATVALSVAVHTGSTHDHLAPSGACETTQGIVLWVPEWWRRRTIGVRMQLGLARLMLSCMSTVRSERTCRGVSVYLPSSFN